MVDNFILLSVRERFIYLFKRRQADTLQVTKNKQKYGQKTAWTYGHYLK